MNKIIFRALQYRNYRLFFIGQSISLSGTWMQQIAMGWLVYRLTNSALLLGVVGFFGQLPAFIFTPIGGVLADRHNRRTILIITQTLAMLQAFILAALVLSNYIKVWHIIGLSVFLGLVNSFDIPVRQAFTVEMIENKDDLANAIALNSSMVNMARLIGPSLGGIIIAVMGEGLCFLLNGISYIAVIISLFAMNIRRQHGRVVRRHIFHELKEGFVYAFGFAPIRYILLLLSLISLMGVPYQVLMPIFAKDIFHGGPKTLGILMAMAGIGALGGAIYLAGRKTVVGLTRVIALSAGAFGLGVALFSHVKILWVSLPIICVAAFAMMIEMAASNTVLQTVVEENKRGRIMSFFTMSFMGMSPFGSLLAGGLASKIGAPNTLLFGGACCMLGAFLFFKKLPLIRKKIHPVYVEKGILPEVAKGIGAASGLEALSGK